MAYDDYWDRRQDEADRVRRASKAASDLHDALHWKRYDRARWIVGVPPAGAGSDDPDPLDDLDEPEDRGPQTVDDQFREHKRELLFDLEWADGFLPRELLRDWWLRVEPLDLAEAEAGLAAIEAIRDEYRHAADRHEPSITEVSRRVDWDYHVPRIGEEIGWVERLFRHVLSFG